MNFEHTAKLAVVRSKLAAMKLHSNLTAIKWQVVPADICKYMRISINKQNVPVLEVSDEVLVTNSLDTIVVMFVHEFAHRIFKHFEKLEHRRTSKDGALLSMLEYNLIADFTIDDFLKNNTDKIKLDGEIRILLASHIKAVQDYFTDLYAKYVDMYTITKHIFQDKPQFEAMNIYATAAINEAKLYPGRITYKYAYMFDGKNIKYVALTFDNIVNTSIMLKKMIIEMRREITKLEAKAKQQKQNSQPNNQSQDDIDSGDATASRQDENGTAAQNPEQMPQQQMQNDDEQEIAPKQDDSIVDPTLPEQETLISEMMNEKNENTEANNKNGDEDVEDKGEGIIDENKDYQKEAANKIIEENTKYLDTKCCEEETKKWQDKLDTLNKMQNQMHDSMDDNKLDKIPDTLHDPSIVTTELMQDEVAIHKSNQFNKVLSKIYTKMNSYGDNATKVDYVWRNPRSLMYLQDEYIIQDVKEIEKTGKKKIAVYIDKSGSMGMGAAKIVNAILQTFSKDLIDVDIWFWNDEVCKRHDDNARRPYKIEELTADNYPKSDGCTSLFTVYEHAYKIYKNEEELTIIVISDFEDGSAGTIEYSDYNPNKNKHWQYLNVHIVTKEYEHCDGFTKFARLNKIIGLDNPTITAQVIND